MKKESWLISGDGVYQNGSRVVSRYGPNINSLLVGHTVGILVDNNHGLHLYVNGVDQGVAFRVFKSDLGGAALFPHILTKNQDYTVNFGQL